MNKKDLIDLTKKYLMETDDNIVGVSYAYNVVGGSLTKDMALSFRVKEKLPESKLDPSKIIPKEIEYLGEKFITDVIQCEYEPVCDSSFYTWQTTPPPNRYILRPLKGGISTINYSSIPGYMGTLGFMAIDNDDNSLVGVSNVHVFVDDPFSAIERTNPSVITNVKNDVVVQPHNSISNPIGIVKKYVPLRLNPYPYWNNVDGALTTLDSSVIDINESWKQLGLTLTSPPPFATTSEIDNLLSTDPYLYSSGNRTGAKGEGITKLKVFALGSSFNIAYNKQGVNTSALFNDSIEFVATEDDGATICQYPINGGDSGSALLADIGGTKKIIGLVFASGSFGGYSSMIGVACRIDNVASQLNISAWNGSLPNYSDKDGIEQYVASGLDNRTNLTYNGKVYWQVGLTNNTPT